MSLGQEDGTVLVSEVIVVDGEVNMSNLELMTWVCSLAPLKYREMTILMVYSMESLEDGTSHGKLEFLFDGMSLGQ